MQRRVIAPAALAALLALPACYRVTVITGAPPDSAALAPPSPTQSSPLVIDRPWQNLFVYGLVPPPEVDAKAQCTNGVATVMTERSFLNGLVGAITWSIYTPMHTRVTCVAGAAPR